MKGLINKIVVLKILILLVINNVRASGYQGGFVNAWDSSGIVVSGKVTFVKEKSKSKFIKKNELIRYISSRVAGKFILKVDKYHKGDLKNDTVEFCDLYLYSTAGLRLKSNSKYLVFLQNSQERDYSSKGKHDKMLSALWAIEITNKNNKILDSAIKSYKDYKLLKKDNNKKVHSLKELYKPNKYVYYHFLNEIIKYKVTDAIPELERQLKNPNSERSIISSLSALNTLGVNKTQSLIALLDKPEFKMKWKVLQILSRLKEDKDIIIPAIMKLIYDKEEYIAIDAMSTLLEMEQHNMIPLLIKKIENINSKYRYNAVFALRRYKNKLNEKELAIIKGLANDKDKSIRMIIRQIINNK